MAGAPTSRYQAWYTGRDVTAEEIFRHAFRDFSAELSHEPKKLAWIRDSQHTKLEVVLAAVEDARDYYELRKGRSKARDALVKVSEKIHHYSGIMDVLAQHHPEYTALAWGAMKLLFVGVVNHQNIITKLSEGLSQIADHLPKAELLLRLYPVRQMRQNIIAIYTHILIFLQRALHWYQESKIKHLIHSITRPTELQYDDILATIFKLSLRISEVAMTRSHAEQRDMHDEIRQQTQGQKDLQSSVETLQAMILEMKDETAHNRNLMLEVKATFDAHRVIEENARIDMRHQLSEIQLGQFIDYITVASLLDPLRALQVSSFLSKKRRIRPSTGNPEFWFDNKIQRWNQDTRSSLMIISGTWKVRFHLQTFCAEAVSLLKDSNIPAIWALKTITPDEEKTSEVSSIDLIKYLIAQAVGLNGSIHTDATLAPRLKSYVGAKTEDDWINLFGSVLQGIPILYMILDLELLGESLGGPSVDFWAAASLRIFNELSSRGATTVIRVALVNYRLSGRVDKRWDEYIVNVGSVRQAKAPLAKMRRGKAAVDSSADTLNLMQLRPRRGKGSRRS